MKDITDEWHLRLEDKLEGMRELAGIGQSSHEIPLDVMDAIHRTFRFYEVDDIHDLEMHYPFLSRTVRPPGAWRQWKQRKSNRDSFLDTLITLGRCWSGVDSLSSEQREHYEHQLLDEVSRRALDYHLECDPMFMMLTWPVSRHHPNFWSQNHCSIFNVYLRNFQQIRREYFEAYIVNISDRSDRNIRGAFVHYTLDPMHPPSKKVFVDALKVLDASPATTFDFDFVALSPGYRVYSRDGTYRLRGKQLRIDAIHRHDGERKHMNIPTEGVGLPVLR